MDKVEVQPFWLSRLLCGWLSGNAHNNEGETEEFSQLKAKATQICI